MARAPRRKRNKSCNLACSVGRSGVPGSEPSAAMTRALQGCRWRPQRRAAPLFPKPPQAEAVELRACARRWRGRLLRPGDVLCRRPLWVCRHNPGGARWRRGGRLRGGGREDLRHVGKKRVRSDSRARLGNAGPGGPATSKLSPGVSARVCEKTAVGEVEGAWGGSACRKALGRRLGLCWDPGGHS